MDSDDDMIQMPNDYKANQYSDDDHHDHSDHSSNPASQSSRGVSGNRELTYQQRLQYDLLKVAIQSQRSTPYQDQITKEIINKLNALSQAANGTNGQQTVNIKIQQLALNKLLVLNYGKSDFRLVIAHYHLGQAYLAYQCVEQAIEHISIALHKNQKLVDQLPSAQLLQINMQIALAQAFIAQNNYDDAIQTLNKAKFIQENYNQDERSRGQEPTINIKALVLKSQCLCKQQHHYEALQVIDEVIGITKNDRGNKMEYAFALVEKANILSEMDSYERYQKAIEYQVDAINILVEENYHKPEQVAEMYSTLGNYYEKIANIQSCLTCIQKVKTLYEEVYSPEDRRVIKSRRKIATTLLKSGRHKQAVTQLLEIAKLEEKVFGQSMQLGRTLKLLGTVYISLTVGDARVYLKRALNIFQSLGNKKQVQEIRQKLKTILNENNRETDLHMISQQDI